MGRRGPPKMPTKLKVLHGETRKERLNPREPKPRERRPHLSKAWADANPTAASVWRRVMRDFGPTGVITSVDAEALRIYCEAVARYEKAAAQLELEGLTVLGARGGWVKNPVAQIVRDSADLVRQFARELGLTPSARTGLKMPEAEQPADPLEKWMRGSGS